jgi:hypothetical protein
MIHDNYQAYFDLSQSSSTYDAQNGVKPKMLALLDQLSKDIVDPEKFQPARAMLFDMAHNPLYFNYPRTNEWVRVHEQDSTRQDMSKRFLQIAHKIRDAVELTVAGHNIDETILSLCTQASYVDYNINPSAQDKELFAHALKNTLDTNPKVVPYYLDKYNAEKLYDREDVTALVIDSAHRITATEGRDKDGNDPEAAQKLLTSRLVERANRDDRHLIGDHKRKNQDFAALNILANQAIAFSQDIVKNNDNHTTKEQKTELRQKNTERNAQSSKNVLDCFDNIKDKLSPNEQMLFWIRIHSEARSGSKIHRMARKQMQQALDEIPVNQIASYGVRNGGLRSLMNDRIHTYLPGVDDVKINRKTKHIVAHASLNYLTKHNDAINTLGEHHETAAAYRAVLDTFTTDGLDQDRNPIPAKNKAKASSLANKVIKTVADNLSPLLKDKKNWAAPHFLVNTLIASKDRGLTIPLDTVKDIDIKTRHARPQNPTWGGHEETGNNYFIERYEKEALSLRNTKKEREKIWDRYQENIRNIEQPGYQLNSRLESTERMAHKFAGKSKKTIEAASKEIVPVIKEHIDSIRLIDNDVLGQVDAIYGANQKIQAMESIAVTAGRVFDGDITSLAHEKQTEIRNKFSYNEKSITWLDERLQMNRSYIAEKGVTSQSIKAVVL